jgi:hypothetical protein
MRIRRQEGERSLGIALVLCQMKRDSPQLMELRIDMLQIRSRSVFPRRALLAGGRSQLFPQGPQHCRVEILQPAHRRCDGGERAQLGFRRRWHVLPALRRGFAQTAQRREQTPRKSSPESEVWIQTSRVLEPRQRDQTRRARFAEAGLQPLDVALRQDDLPGVIRSRVIDQPTSGRERQSVSHGGRLYGPEAAGFNPAAELHSPSTTTVHSGRLSRKIRP